VIGRGALGAVVFDAFDGCAWGGVPEPGGLEDGAELVATAKTGFRAYRVNPGHYSIYTLPKHMVTSVLMHERHQNGKAS
jgi:hypothetical protein